VTTRGPLRAAIYTHVIATAHLAEDRQLLLSQRRWCEGLLYRRGWRPVRERFDDRGPAGRKHRPALRRLFAAVDARLVDVIVATGVERLCPSLIEAARLLERFERCGVVFHAAEPVLIRVAGWRSPRINVRLPEKVA
jgi:DNA invertase Pin-like site-specific DNA recombinase